MREEVCKIDNCDREKKYNNICSVEGCNINYNVYRYLGDNKLYCERHKTQLRLYGKIRNLTILSPNEYILKKSYAIIVLRDIKLKKVGETKVDLEDVEKLKQYKFYLDKNGRPWTLDKKSKKSMSIGKILLNNFNKEKLIMYKNNDSLDNRKKNIKIVTQSEMAITNRKNSKNKSGTVGVCWSKERRKWCSYITVRRKVIPLGRFTSLDTAIRKRKEAEIKYFGKIIQRKNEIKTL